MQVSDDDVRRLIATLVADGSPDALTAAALLTRGVEGELGAVALSCEQRIAVLGCLEDAAAAMAELRGVLLRELGGSPPICENSPLWEP